MTNIIELTHFGLLRFSGQDASAFLHGQVSCDVEGLPVGHATYGSYNTPKGRMLASFLLWRTSDALFMQLPRALATPIKDKLKRFVLRSKVEIIESDDVLFGVIGAHIENAGIVTTLKLDDTRAIAHVSAAHADDLRSKVTTTDTTAWDVLDIKAGIAWILPQTQELFVPQMVNLDKIAGISFNKGCYPGQEIVARMHYLGKLKQRMFRARIASDVAPQPGDAIYSAAFGTQASGHIVNAALVSEGNYEVLAVLHIEDANASTAAGVAHWNAPNGATLTIETLPY